MYLTRDYYSWFINDREKIKTGKNMAEFPEIRHIIPVVNLPVTNLSILKLRKSQKFSFWLLHF